MDINDKQLLNILFLICLGLLLNSLELVTIKKVCEYPEHGPLYFGFPMIYRTNMTWVNTGSGVIFILNWIINVVFWILVSTGFWHATKKLLKWEMRFPKALKLIVIVIVIILQIIEKNALDLNYKIVHDVKMDYYKQEINCKSKLLFFNLGIDDNIEIKQER